MEKIRASNYFSECDQIRGKIFDMLKSKTRHLVCSIFIEVCNKVVNRLANPDFLKLEKHPRLIEQFMLYFGKFYREINYLANKELVQSLKLNLFLSVHKAIQKAFLHMSKNMFKKVTHNTSDPI